MLVVAVAPKISAMPNNTNAEENVPSKKYFSEDSSDSCRSRANPASTYNGIDRNSSARKTMIRLYAPVSSIIPAIESSISG